MRTPSDLEGHMKRIRLILGCLAVLTGVAMAAQPEYQGKVFLGLGGVTARLAPDDRHQSTHGIVITRLPAGSTGEKTGLQIGDVIVSIDGKAWTSEQIRLSRSFGKAGKKATPGQTAELVVLRPDGKNGQLLKMTVTLQRHPRTEKKPLPSNAELRSDLQGKASAVESLCWRAIALAGAESDARDLLRRLALLYEQDGNDEYYCKGLRKSGYGTDGVFEGWGQGVGMGYRPYASGGVGALIDGAGDDRMETGNFGQGGGYFYAFGLLYAGGDGDDTYIGSRYAQGFTAHQAAGAMIEAGGNDRYTTRYSVAQGLSWDESVTLLLDQSGDDLYEGGGFSQGAADMNGWTLFIDQAGLDQYSRCRPAHAGGNAYHGGKSISLFVDASGAQDRYASDRVNNAFLHGSGDWLFLDLPSTMAEASQGRHLENLQPVQNGP